MANTLNMTRRTAIKGLVAAGASIPGIAQADEPAPIYQRIAELEHATELFHEAIDAVEDAEKVWNKRRADLGIVQTPATITGCDTAAEALAHWDDGNREPFCQLRGSYLDVGQVSLKSTEAEIARIHAELSRAVPFLNSGDVLAKSQALAVQVARVVYDRYEADEAKQILNRREDDWEVACNAEYAAFIALLACPIATRAEADAKRDAINASSWNSSVWEAEQIDALLSGMVPQD